MAKNPIAKIEMKNGAIIKIELDFENAPNTVRNYIALANAGFYDGLNFHRVIPGFMIQGGCPLGSGTGGPGYKIKGEFPANGFDNKLKHERGTISMARSQENNSAGSQFFITVKNADHLDGQYAAFGKVIEGMGEVDKIVSAPRNHHDKPLEEQKIKNISVDTFDAEYEPPEKI